eukprot:TRINITY_DN96935_c0_g1_i1.p1 TRINITY_DN96935_c0_g1~~TRINITY_DN96935_c0_g1_i1.p1  ORF type:complete len:140 (+),score=5.16 TRINITY_DN96935_c0_g1_i1:64-483(+)
MNWRPRVISQWDPIRSNILGHYWQILCKAGISRIAHTFPRKNSSSLFFLSQDGKCIPNCGIVAFCGKENPISVESASKQTCLTRYFPPIQLLRLGLESSISGIHPFSLISRLVPTQANFSRNPNEIATTDSSEDCFSFY